MYNVEWWFNVKKSSAFSRERSPKIWFSSKKCLPSMLAIQKIRLNHHSKYHCDKTHGGYDLRQRRNSGPTGPRLAPLPSRHYLHIFPFLPSAKPTSSPLRTHRNRRRLIFRGLVFQPGPAAWPLLMTNITSDFWHHYFLRWVLLGERMKKF